MLWILLLLMLLGTAFLDCTLQADLHCFGDTDLRVLFRVAGLRKSWRYQLSKTAQGHQLNRTDSHGTKPIIPSQLRQSRGSLLADTLRRVDRARHFLLSHIRLERLDGLILLHTEDAAASALLSGAVRGLLACIPAVQRPNVLLRVLPEFFRTHTTVNARCIIHIRLGTIILTAGMLLAAWIRQQRPTESEAIAYGTSHR